MEMSRHSRHKNVLRPFYCDSGGKIFLSIVQFGANSCTLSVLSNTPTIYYYRLFRPKNKSKIKKNFGSGGAAAFPDSCMHSVNGSKVTRQQSCSTAITGGSRQLCFFLHCGVAWPRVSHCRSTALKSEAAVPRAAGACRPAWSQTSPRRSVFKLWESLFAHGAALHAGAGAVPAGANTV
jgi:hypothetical protein